MSQLRRRKKQKRPKLVWLSDLLLALIKDGQKNGQFRANCLYLPNNVMTMKMQVFEITHINDASKAKEAIEVQTEIQP